MPRGESLEHDGAGPVLLLELPDESHHEFPVEGVLRNVGAPGDLVDVLSGASRVRREVGRGRFREERREVELEGLVPTLPLERLLGDRAQARYLDVDTGLLADLPPGALSGRLAGL